MSNSITISYPGSNPAMITLSYSIELLGDVQTINCSVDEKHFPIWLQLKKFSMTSLKKKNSYVPLFNELNNSRNMATSLFIDTAYTDIMRTEKMEVYKFDN